MVRFALLFVVLGAGQAEYVEKPLTQQDRAHWAFRPPVRPELPAGSSAENPIDRFVDARLAKSGLEPLPEADRATLLRRVTFDLTGLPPTPAEVEAFLGDGDARAYEVLVDRLLGSRAYGERWAQFWLDVARFAETDGFEHDKIRPDAWRYRDWVIDALNADLPYDRFVRLQLAADELEPQSAAATGILMGGPDMPDINRQEERRSNILNEMTGVVGAAFMGLSFGCAQCHDHKEEPISHADFFRIRAVFANIVWTKKDKALGSVAAEPGASVPPEPLLLRGDFRRPGPVVEPGFPRLVNPEGRVFSASPAGKSSGRRKAFAEWLTRPDHPLTARVAMNWMWTHHFGRGIVPTPGNFGTKGARPSHPELLDWLATELPRQGWSLKAMHRLMVTSSAYRRASRPARDDDPRWRRGEESDPANAMLWRMSRRRLEGEAVRDAVLFVAGRLSDRRGGPGVRPPLPPEITVTLLKDQWEVTKDEEDHRRRSIYLFARRNLRYPLFDVFDRPAPDECCAQRSRSTTATQSLALLNSPLLRAEAAKFAARLEGDPAARISRAVMLALSRPATPRDVERGAQFLSTRGEAALADFCLALLNSNEFVYVD